MTNGTMKKARRKAMGGSSSATIHPRRILIAGSSRLVLAGRHGQVHERDMLLAAIHVAVAALALPDRANEGDLDRPPLRHDEERGDLRRADAVGEGDGVAGHGIAVADRAEALLVAEQDVEGEAIGARILAADDTGVVAQPMLAGRHLR